MMYTAALLFLVIFTTLCQAGPEIDCGCGPGWTLRGNKCLKWVPERVEWEGARHTCANMKTTLAMPKTKKENMYLSQIRDENGGSEIWIGLRNKRIGTHADGGQYWVDGTKLDKKKFPAGTSNNRYIPVYHVTPSWENGPIHWTDYLPEDCFHMRNKRYNIAWNDNKCKTKMPFVCEKEISSKCECPEGEGWTLYGDKCYKYMGIQAWEPAFWKCYNSNSIFAMPKTPLENKYLSYIRDENGGQALWIGLRRAAENNVWVTRWQDNVFHPRDKTKLTYRPNGSKITGYRDYEQCFRINSRNHGLAWDALKCKTKLGFVCQKNVKFTTK